MGLDSGFDACLFRTAKHALIAKMNLNQSRQVYITGGTCGKPFNIMVLSLIKQLVPTNSSSSTGASISNTDAEFHTLQYKLKTVDKTANAITVIANGECAKNGKPAQLANGILAEAVLADHQRLQRLQVDEKGVHGVTAVAEIGMSALETVLTNFDGMQQCKAR